MKKIIATLALVAMASTAQAADWETGKGDRWTGVYIGGIAAGTGGTVETYWENVDWAQIIGGGTIGYNYQMGDFVMGLESNLMYGCFAIEGAGQCVDNFEATALGRLGYDINGVLLYAAGGVVYDDLSVYGLSVDTVNWIAGGGVEIDTGGGWSVKGEVLYHSGLETAQGRVGINYRF